MTSKDKLNKGKPKESRQQMFYVGYMLYRKKPFKNYKILRGPNSGGTRAKNVMETQPNKISSTLLNLNFLQMVFMKSMAECHLTYFHLVIRQKNASRKL